jgi:hypothetical protein
MRRAKIVCTLGPAVESPEKVRELIAAGMNMARLNLSHGGYPEHQSRLDQVRAAAAEAHRDDLRSIIEDYRRALPPGPMATSETEPTTNPPLTATAAPDGFDAGSGRSLVKALTRRIPRRSRS